MVIKLPYNDVSKFVPPVCTLIFFGIVKFAQIFHIYCRIRIKSVLRLYHVMVLRAKSVPLQARGSQMVPESKGSQNT